MAISTSLIAKGIAGTLSLAAPVATSVYYKDSIYELFVPKLENGSWETKQETSESKIKVTYSGKGCSVKLTGDSASSKLSEVETQLKGKLGITGTLNENHKRYRRGLIKKCGNNNEVNLNITDSSKIDLSSLFNLDDETLSNIESKDIIDKTFTISETTETNKISLTIAVEYTPNSSDITVSSCKIIGSAKSGETIEKNKLDSSKEEIKNSVKGKIDSEVTNNKENNRKNFLTTCKRSFDNEIKLSLVAKTGDTGKYELEGLDGIFKSSTNTQ